VVTEESSAHDPADTVNATFTATKAGYPDPAGYYGTTDPYPAYLTE